MKGNEGLSKTGGRVDEKETRGLRNTERHTRKYSTSVIKDWLMKREASKNGVRRRIEVR